MAVALSAVLICAGCTSLSSIKESFKGFGAVSENPYTELYRGESLETPSQEVTWKESNDIETTSQELRAQGYLQIGSVAFALFSSTFHPYHLDDLQVTEFAMEQARHVGAELVVTCHEYGSVGGSTYYEGSLGPYGMLSVYPMEVAVSLQYYGATYWVKKTNPLARERQGPQLARPSWRKGPFVYGRCYILPEGVAPPRWPP